MDLENGNQDFDYDLVTIGAGSGGVRASRVSAASYGAKVRISFSLRFTAQNCSVRSCHWMLAKFYFFFVLSSSIPSFDVIHRWR